MKSFLLIVGLTGCFYLDPVNQRPSLEIVNTTGDRIERGQENVTLIAQFDDPEGHLVDLAWRMFVCDDASNIGTCDAEPAREGSGASFAFTAPIARANAAPAQSLLVELDGTDDLGAAARPSQQLIIPLSNARPSLVVTHASEYGNTITTPIDVFAVYGDADDTAANVTLTYELFKPNASTATLTDVCTPQPGCLTPADDSKLEQGKRFVPDVEGEWQVRITAVDPLGGDEGSTQLVETVVVVVDQLPCLGVVSPSIPTGTNVLPMTEPTLFQVHQVVDAIDPFPTDLGDTILGQSSFHWSLRVNGGPRQVLATETGNSLALDPASFDLDDDLEVRVEIADRASPFPLTCDPLELTCKLDPTIDCLQRQTWKVEVR